MIEYPLSECSLIETDKTSLTMTTDDGSDIRCSIIRIFHTPAQDYIVLMPEDGSTHGTGYLLRFAIDTDGMPLLENIPDEEEYAAASEVFHALTADFSFEENDPE